MKSLPLCSRYRWLRSCASANRPARSFPSRESESSRLSVPAQLGYPYGPIEVKYDIDVQNNAAEPITLMRVEITLNLAAARTAFGAASTLQAGDSSEQHRRRHVLGKGILGGRGRRENEPVSLRGVAYFESASGTFQKVFVRELSQNPND